MDIINTAIWQKFHIHRHDNLPYTPWVENADRIMLACFFGELGLNHGAEIGVRTGGYSQVLLEANKNLELLCVDTWAPYGRVSQNRQDRYYRMCVNRLAPYKAKIMKMSSMDALKEVPDGSLDFVYIDGAHDFDNVMMDLIGWANKVRRGGIIAGHDYYHFYQGGVVLAVDAYTRAHNVQSWYITKEATPSWFWCKP
jgi:hypothetical protein